MNISGTDIIIFNSICNDACPNSQTANYMLNYYYAYNTDNSLKYTNVNTETTRGNISYTYDAYDRLSGKVTTLYSSSNSARRFVNTVVYEFADNSTYGLTYTSVQVSKYTTQVGSNTAQEFRYSYDSKGNITEIRDSGDTVQYRYEYDDLGQLVREDNRAKNYSYVYEYDHAGNITAKKLYGCTTGTLGNLRQTYSYSYDDSSW